MTDHKQSVSVSSPASGSINIHAEYSGVLPHPSIVQQYDQLVPGAAREILNMAQTQQIHRMEMEKKEQEHDHKLLNSTLKLQLIGQVTAALIILSTLFISFYLIFTGHSIEGLVAVLLPLAGVAAVVIKGRKESSD